MQFTDLRIKALGSLVRVSFDYSVNSHDPQLHSHFVHAWSGAREEDPHRVADISFSWVFPDWGDLEESLAELSTHVTLAAIEQQRGRSLMLHAAGLADPAGRVFCLVGPSGMGKTTLSRALGAGWAYVSDETVAVSFDGVAHAYRKPLSVKRPGAAFKEQVAPVDLGLLPVDGVGLKLGAIAILDRVTDTNIGVEVDELPLCEAIVALVAEASYLADLPRPLKFIAQLVAVSGPIVKVTYSEAEDVVAEREQLAAQRTSAEWEQVISDGTEPGLIDQKRNFSYSPAAVRDAVASEGQTLIFGTDGTLRLLEGIGPSIWLGLIRGSSIRGIAVDLVELFGPPQHLDPEDLIRAALDSLVDQGLVRRVSGVFR